MPESPTGDSGEELANPHPNIGALGKSTCHAILDYLEARLLLLKVESQEASLSIARRAALFVSASSLITFSYLAAMTAGISLLSERLDARWEHVALCAAGAHAIVGLIVIAVARARFSKPLFEHSLKELEKDAQWLQDRKTR